MINLFKYRLKILFSNKEGLFWVVMFPLFLATLFHFAFSNIISVEKFSKVKTGVLINNGIKKEEHFLKFLESSDYNELITYNDEDTVKKALETGKIEGYYKYTDKLELIIKENEFEQTILESVLSGYLQTYKLVENTYKETGKFDQSVLSIRENHIEGKFNKNSNFAMSYFYTIIAMSALYAAFTALYTLTSTEANLSKVGSRFSVAPTHKIKILFVNVISGTIFNMIAITILFIYLKFILGVSFGDNTLPAYILSLIGTITGISLGLLVSSVFKGSENVKGGLISLIVMTMSGLSGMFSSNIKMFIDTKAPIINKYNPSALITDTMNYLYRYNELNLTNIYRLVVITLILFFISYIFIRRKKYDSI